MQRRFCTGEIENRENEVSCMSSTNVYQRLKAAILVISIASFSPTLV